MSELKPTDYKHLADMRQREKQSLREEVSLLRNQVLQLQKISEYLEEHYYNPMTKGFFRRIWYAAWISWHHRRKQQPTKKTNENDDLRHRDIGTARN